MFRLSVKLLRLLQNYPPPDDPGVRGRLNECLETILNKAQEPPKSKKVLSETYKNINFYWPFIAFLADITL